MTAACLKLQYHQQRRKKLALTLFDSPRGHRATLTQFRLDD
jgi:hypothetical protein